VHRNANGERAEAEDRLDAIYDYENEAGEENVGHVFKDVFDDDSQSDEPTVMGGAGGETTTTGTALDWSIHPLSEAMYNLIIELFRVVAQSYD
jgi:hypothetical protein